MRAAAFGDDGVRQLVRRHPDDRSILPVRLNVVSALIATGNGPDFGQYRDDTNLESWIPAQWSKQCIADFCADATEKVNDDHTQRGADCIGHIERQRAEKSGEDDILLRPECVIRR